MNSLSLDQQDKLHKNLHEARAIAMVLTHAETEQYIQGEISTLSNMILERVEVAQEIIKGVDQA